jgi:hypothetical protein
MKQMAGLSSSFGSMDSTSQLHTFTSRLIHNVPELIEKTAALISDEWPRGISARYAFFCFPFNFEQYLIVL